MALTYPQRYDLAMDGDFQHRVMMASLEYTATVMGETQTISPKTQVYWDKRRALAQTVINDAPGMTAAGVVPASILRIAVFAAAKFSDARVPTVDADVLNQVSVFWDDLAGVNAAD